MQAEARGATALPERLSDDSGWNVYRSGLLWQCSSAGLCVSVPWSTWNAAAFLLQ